MRLQTRVDARFCEQPVDAQKLRRAIREQRDELRTLRERLRGEPSELERTRLGRTLNRLSRYLRLDDACQEAGELCREAIDIWEALGRERAAYLARLRLAAIEMRAGRLDEAHRRADRLVDEASDPPYGIYRDFALELRGRIHARRNEIDRALEDLRAALEFRRDEQRTRLVERTERVLELLDDDD